MKQATFEQPTSILLSVYFTLWILVCGTCWVNTSEHLALTKCPPPFFPQSSVHRAKTEWISSVCAYANVYIPPFVFSKPINFCVVLSNWYEARSEFIACGEVWKLGRRRGCGTPDNKNNKRVGHAMHYCAWFRIRGDWKMDCRGSQYFAGLDAIVKSEDCFICTW